MPRSLKRSLALRFTYQNFLYISHVLPNACYVFRPAHTPQFMVLLRYSCREHGRMKREIFLGKDGAKF